MLFCYLQLQAILRRRRGAVALEAILSILLMLGAFYTMWGAALIVYNQSKLNTGAQFAADGALVVYDRSSYRGDPQYHARAKDKAESAANSLLRENAFVGMAPDQFTGAIPTQEGSINFRVVCSSSISGGGSEDNCSRRDPQNAAATRISLRASASGSYWLLSPLSNASRGREADEQTTKAPSGSSCPTTLCSGGLSLSAGPEATP